MQHALNEFGVKEGPGRAKDNARIIEYFTTMGKAKWRFTSDHHEWCSAFVNWVLEQTSIPGTDKPTARSWMKWGTPLPKDSPMYGAITVFWRGSRSGWQGHVGFFSGMENGKILVLGGNQKGASGGGSNQVSLRPYPTRRLLGFRWPTEYAREIVCRA
ncbi:MAG: TIGR02594 family protein [Gammaproteobacteria bacterium]|nr:TIGR02594 family protein [Gammaproteobacteria bacterium]